MALELVTVCPRCPICSPFSFIISALASVLVLLPLSLYEFLPVLSWLWISLPRCLPVCTHSSQDFLGWAGSNGVRVLQSSYPIIPRCSGQVAALLHVHTHRHKRMCIHLHIVILFLENGEHLCRLAVSSLIPPLVLGSPLLTPRGFWSLYHWLYMNTRNGSFIVLNQPPALLKFPPALLKFCSVFDFQFSFR